MLIDFEDDFADLLVDWQLITHSAGSDNSFGRHIPGSASAPVIIQATEPQPVSANDLIKDPGGEFVRDLQKTYTAAVVKTRDDDVDPDQMIYGGVTYEVFQVEDRSGIAGYRKVILRKLQGDR